MLLSIVVRFVAGRGVRMQVRVRHGEQVQTEQGEAAKDPHRLVVAPIPGSQQGHLSVLG